MRTSKPTGRQRSPPKPQQRVRTDPPLPRPDPKLQCLGLPELAAVSGVTPVASNLIQTARIGVQHALLRISDCALTRALGKVSFYALLVGPDAARDTIIWSLGMPSAPM